MLLIGPPGSGKTYLVLEKLSAALGERREAQTMLVVPTASMAQHLTHELARRGHTVPGELILPLAGLIEKLTPDLEEPSPAVDAWLIKRALEEGGGATFAPLAGKTGFENRVARTLQELQAARCRPDDFARFASKRTHLALAQVYRLYQRFLDAHGLVSRAERLERAAQHAALHGLDPVGEILFDGFFSLSVGERDLMRSLATAGLALTVTAVDPPPAGFLPELPRKRLEKVRRDPVEPRVVAAPGIEQEVEEMARGIVEYRRETNQPFHQIGVVLRSPETYASQIQAAFERFGIPFRLRRPSPLAAHAAVRLVRDLLRAAADGLPAEATLEALLRPCSPVGVESDTDAWDFRVREALPGDGLETLRKDAPAAVSKALDALEEVAAEAGRRRPPAAWARLCAEFASRQIRYPRVADGLSPERTLELRAFGQAVRQLGEAFDEAARLLDLQSKPEVKLAGYLDALDGALAAATLRVPDRRRDVVNVLSVYEARQWELAAVFVPGMVEGEFPRKPPEDLLLVDRDREQLKQGRFELLTRAELAAEEEFLFRIATTRARERLVLSYPQTDRGGAPLVRSFFLPADASQDRPASGVKPLEKPADAAAPIEPIADPRLLEAIFRRHEAFSPSGIDSYLQCPYQFFAGKTLRLEGRPCAAYQRLDALWKGSVIHETISEWSKNPESAIHEALERVFDSKLAESRLTPGFQSELMKAVMRRDLERFSQHPAARPDRERLAGNEKDIRYVVEPGEGRPFDVRGRIDRCDLADGNRALVIDYKYSPKDRITKLFKRHEEGGATQAFLYLSGMQAAESLEPGGALLWGLRKEVTVRGWVLPEIHRAYGFDAKMVAPTSADELRVLVDRTRDVTSASVAAIRMGRIAAEPLDRGFCKKFCDYRDICRIEL